MRLEEPKKHILRLINEGNKLNIRQEEVLIHTPELFLKTTPVTTNSRVIVEAIDTHRFTGNITVYYNRVPIAAYLNGCTIPGNAGNYSTKHQVIQAVIKKYSLPLLIEEISDGYITGTTVELMPTNGSFVFIPTNSATLNYE